MPAPPPPVRPVRDGRARAAATAMLAGVLADAVLADPRRGHPVALFGTASARVQQALERDSRAAGVAHWALCVGAVAAGAAAGQRATRDRPLAGQVLLAWSTWAVLGATTLGREARGVADAVAAGDLAGARSLLPRLCGRDPASLDGAGLLRATVESVAENTGDAAVSPLLWGAVAGVPGLLAFRAVNTLDAMVGHRSPRYRRFGWASARADDLAGLAWSRVGAGLVCLLAPLVGGDTRRARAAWRRDAGAHPSPNAGPLEAAFAGALDLRLGGPVDYRYGVSDRPWLQADGRDPRAGDVATVVRLSRLVTLATTALAVAVRCALLRAGGTRTRGARRPGRHPAGRRPTRRGGTW